MISVSSWYQHKYVSDAKKRFNEVFENICEYFVNNRLSHLPRPYSIYLYPHLNVRSL